MDTRERLKALESRCSGFALELLRHLDAHPKFSELILRLENIQGQLYRTDIEQEYFALVKDGSDTARPR